MAVRGTCRQLGGCGAGEQQNPWQALRRCLAVAVDQPQRPRRQMVASTQGLAQTADTGTQDMAAHSLQATEQNVRATLDFAQKLTQVKSLQAAMQLQADFARSQFAAVQAQANEFVGMAQSATKQGAEHAMDVTRNGADQSRMSMEDGDEVGR